MTLCGVHPKINQKHQNMKIRVPLASTLALLLAAVPSAAEAQVLEQVVNFSGDLETEMIFPLSHDGRVWDLKGKVKKVTIDAGDGLTTDVEFDENGRLLRNGDLTYRYDADGRLAECAPSKKAWHNKNIFYVETRRHLSRSAMHRLRFNLDMSSLHACLLSAVCSAAWAAVSGAWLILPFSLAALLAPLAVRTLNAKRAMGVFGVDVPLWKVFPFETDIIWHNLKYAINYKFADKYEFISHKS